MSPGFADTFVGERASTSGAIDIAACAIAGEIGTRIDKLRKSRKIARRPNAKKVSGQEIPRPGFADSANSRGGSPLVILLWVILIMPQQRLDHPPPLPSPSSVPPLFMILRSSICWAAISVGTP